MRGWRDHNMVKLTGGKQVTGLPPKTRDLAWAGGVDYDLLTNSGVELQISGMRRSCVGI